MEELDKLKVNFLSYIEKFHTNYSPPIGIAKEYEVRLFYFNDVILLVKNDNSNEKLSFDVLTEDDLIYLNFTLRALIKKP